ncbi:MAG: hypothetical protein KAY22_11810 [Rhizorhabdus sp.]|uniref:hypothetical protein n=1 Tax=Rhizorhabdus sp. TaxID=1968843 RepID=UPI001B673333|nr:hypothetical protein [Rhizorhabdus sp.]MBP8232982.1 hypothetical protein [Rhizorhabdus sp.]
MQHQVLSIEQPWPGQVFASQDELSRIVTSLDARFLQVGTTLAAAVEAIDKVVASLNIVGTVFQSGDAAAAVDNLTSAARRLFDVSAQVSDRASEVSLIRSASSTLRKYVDEVQRTLEVLQIYSMNVKIAASGAPDFVEFADVMRQQLTDGKIEADGFGIKLEQLEASLAGMERTDRLLASECARVVPQVPERLLQDASDLREHQAQLAKLAESTGQMARSIQGNVAAVLGAIQIGDIARQRLEHVLTGCTLLDAFLAGPEGAADIGAQTRHHVLAMLVAQLVDTACDFRRETEVVIGSLRALGPQAGRLLALKDHGGNGEDGQIFLRRLETGIADAAAMLAQLHCADRQADETLKIIIATVADLSTRVVAIRDLRLDVQQMAINIGLRCRRVESIGRAVTVISNEIRGYSEKLDATIGGITKSADELNMISLRMRDRSNAAGAGAGDELTRSLDAIREGARRTEQAMKSATTEANGILGMLRQTTDELEAGLDLGGIIEGIATTLADEVGSGAPLPPDVDHPARLVLDEIARTYTMASERRIHDQFRIGEPIALAAAATMGGDDGDDDALFDDALF